jgi:hypothetical protein
MKNLTLFFIVFFLQPRFYAQTDTAKKSVPDKQALKFNISADGSHYFQVTFLNQA